MIIVREVTAPPSTPATPPTPTSKLREFSVSLVGVDGSEWDLSNGPVRLLGGIKMLGTAKPTHWHGSSPALDGSVWQGMRTAMRDDSVLPIAIDGNRDSVKWRELEDDFFKAIDPRGTFTVTVARPDSQARSLTLRYADGGDPESTVDPMTRAFSTYAVECVAADPFWRGEKVIRRYEAEEAPELFPGPPFHIGSSNTIASGKADNPGDVDTWPKWTVTGPSTAFTVGVGKSTVQQSGTLAAGEKRIVDMNPAHRVVVDDTGKDQWVELIQADFAPIPPGQNVNLSMELTGAAAGTSIQLEYTPGYRRAW